MPIWKHAENGGKESLGPVQFPFSFPSDQWREEEFTCSYCHHRMERHIIADYWKLDFQKIEKFHNKERTWLVKNCCDDGDYLELRGDINETLSELLVCPACGWWIAMQSFELPSRDHQVWAMTLASAGALLKLDEVNIDLPLNELRQYLCAKYDSRFFVSPRKFEELVADVFSDFGYVAQLTAYACDGGIDCILTGCRGEKIGVQVKRYKSRIEAEQIRAFLGALTLRGYTRGIFVSSSGFQRGAIATAKFSNNFHRPIELVNGERFLEMLGIAQLKKKSIVTECGFNPHRPPTLLCVNHHHLHWL